MYRSFLVAFICISFCYGVEDDEVNDQPDVNGEDSVQQDVDESSERIGPGITQVIRHPYVASLLKHNQYECSMVILNSFWLLTPSKCLSDELTSTYMTYSHFGNFTVRVGSSYNNKGGSIYKIKMLVNHFDMRVTAVKLEAELEFGPRVSAVRLPGSDEEPNLGYLASTAAWNPVGHLRLVNMPLLDSSICEDDTKLAEGHFICLGGVQDPNRHFCRKDNGGAVIQNNTLIAISSFHHVCAVYTRPHAFPKVASFSKWLDTIIWDEHNRPTVSSPTSSTIKEITVENTNTTSTTPRPKKPFPGDLWRNVNMITLPFEPIDVPLVPGQDNSVLPKMSLYESYLRNFERQKTSTTPSPNAIADERREWFQKFGKQMLMLPQNYAKKYETLDYNSLQ